MPAVALYICVSFISQLRSWGMEGHNHLFKALIPTRNRVGLRWRQFGSKDTLFFLKELLIFMYMPACMCACVLQVCSTSRGQKKALYPPGIGFTVVSHAMWVLWFKFWLLGKALNLYTISQTVKDTLLNTIKWASGLGTVACTCHFNTSEAEAGGSQENCRLAWVL